jgi:hypothetical protein
MKEALVGLIIQLRLGSEFGSDNGMADRDGLMDALGAFLGNWPSTDSGSRSTNIKCWDIHPERCEAALQLAIGEVQARGLAERAVIARVDYLAAEEGEDYEWGSETIVWPPDKVGPFSMWPEWPGF